MTFPSAALTVHDGELRRVGQRHQILAGSMHPFRVHPELWQDRIERIAALGCNTIDSYVAWNLHQPHEDQRASFDGVNDLARFADRVAAAGLDLIVRPGPYICAEWDNGGLPAWLTAKPGIRLRCSDRQYTDAVSAWFDELIPRLVGLQAANGGPLVAVQLENEYGSYADDHDHLEWLRKQLTERGITELLYTADGARADMQAAGSLPGTFAAATFGSDPAGAVDLMQAAHPGAPFFAAEFWSGWFDHWGERHHVRAGEDAAANIGQIVAAGGSVSIYLAHGGTNFGLTAGANHDGKRLQPTVTSYDSDAPIHEDGSAGRKFEAIRAVLRPEWSGAPLPQAPARLSARSLPVSSGAGLLAALRGAGQPERSVHPLSFEELGLDSGLVLYATQTVVPVEEAQLRARGLHDRAVVFVDGQEVGVLEHDDDSVQLSDSGGRAVRLELVVENQGRVNYGPLLGQGKGILGGVLMGRRHLTGWSSRPLPLGRWGVPELELLAVAGGAVAGGAGVFTAMLEAEESADAFLALPGFSKGFVWIDGFLLGRYWDRGPQRTLYVPSPLVHDGAIVTILELHRAGDRIELVAEPELGAPEPYVETL